MMSRVIAVVALLAFADAKRIEVNDESLSDAQSNFFESCDDLQGIFRRRMASVHSLVDAHPNATGMNAINRARFTMRTFGVVRTLRRAKDCDWVVDGNSEDIEEAQAIVQTTLAGNPCAEAAVAELTPEAYESAAHELIPLQRAMLVLVSDTCVVPELEVIDVEDHGVQDRSAESDEEMQNTVDELFEEAALEGEGGAEASLMQSEGLVRKFFAWVGAIFFAIAFGLACAVPGWVVGAFIGTMLAIVFCECCSRSVCTSGMMYPLLGAVVGAPLGFATCASVPLIAVAQETMRAPSNGLQH